MKVYNLPDDLFEKANTNSRTILVKYYESRQNRLKNKIVLQKNMINLLISGRKTLCYAAETISVEEQEFLLMSKGNCLTSEVCCKNQVFSCILLYFDDQYLLDFLAKYDRLFPQDSHKETKSFLVYGQDSFIRHYIQSLLVIFQSGKDLSPELAQLKLEELLLYLLEKSPEKLVQLLKKPYQNEDQRIQSAIHSALSQPLSVEELAFLCNMSTSTFKRKFYHIYHTSPKKWLSEQKMQAAAHLLRQAGELPSQVYQKIGYQNHSSFSLAFKQHFGITPRKYKVQSFSQKTLS